VTGAGARRGHGAGEGAAEAAHPHSVALHGGGPTRGVRATSEGNPCGVLLSETLPATPPSVRRARRLVGGALAATPYEPLSETVQLLVSELVTNAVLHAGTDISLTLLDQPDGGVRVEVGDGNPALPAGRSYDPDASTGRGLGLVAMLSIDHGAERRDAGKVVWCLVGPETADDAGADADALLESWADPADRGSPAAATIRLLDAPVFLFRAMQQHSDALLRERALMGGGAVAMAPALDLGRAAEVLAEAAEAGLPAADLDVEVADDAGPRVRALLDALAEADELAFSGRMLTPAALPEVRWCRSWYLQQVAAQLDGAEPTPWTPLDVQQRVTDGLERVDARAVLDALGDPVVVGDDQNRIVYLNRAASALLGWSRDELRGKRLTAIVPDHLRELHIAGYTRYLVTAEPRIMRRPVRVPARCRDGSEVEVELVLAGLRSTDGRPLFAGVLRDVTERLALAERASAARAIATGAAVVRALAARPDRGVLDDVADDVLAAVAPGLGWQVTALWGVDGGALRCLAVDGGDGFAAASRRQRFAPGRGLPGRVWSSGEPTWIPDVVGDPNFPRAEAASAAGLRSALGVPITADGTFAGVLELLTTELLEPGPDLIAAIAAIGDHVGALTRPG
jgi:PAS domain S-box-containing protein